MPNLGAETYSFATAADQPLLATFGGKLTSIWEACLMSCLTPRLYACRPRISRALAMSSLDLRRNSWSEGNFTSGRSRSTKATRSVRP